jgi:hypothetical protein
MEGDELVYLELWFNSMKEGPDALPDPDASEVKAAVREKTGKTLTDRDVTKLKQSFIAKSYLVLIERSYHINSLASLFRRLFKLRGHDDLMFDLMMRNIWKAFYEDKSAVHASRTEVSKELWVSWEALTLRKAVQEKILAEAYKHFRQLRSSLRFCFLIELYADNRFGSKIRQIFMRGGR